MSMNSVEAYGMWNGRGVTCSSERDGTVVLSRCLEIGIVKMVEEKEADVI